MRKFILGYQETTGKKKDCPRKALAASLKKSWLLGEGREGVQG